MSNPSINIENFNNDFLIIKSEDRALLTNTGRSIFESELDYVDEVIVAEAEICVKLNDRFNPSRLSELDNIDSSKGVKSISYKLPIYFDDNEDWDAVERHTGLKKADIISRLADLRFSIAMFGFLPGFVYLDGLSEELHVPRKSNPSKFVDARSVAIGGKYLGIYAIDSPGGWHVLGRIPVSVLNLKALPPVDFNVSDVISLEAVDKVRFDDIVTKGISLKSYNS